MFSARDYITGHDFKIVHCRVCGLTATRPLPSPVEMEQYYPTAYFGAAGARRFPRAIEVLQNGLYAHRARCVEAALGGRPGRVLDVGCGRGWLLHAFKQFGWKVQGTEISASASAHAREVLKLPVAIGRLEDLSLPAGQFDAVMLWHVLEHLPDPHSLLSEVQRLLKPGGVLFIGVPDFGGWEAQFCRDKWFHLDVPRHLTHLTRPTLTSALAVAGFKVKSWSGFAPEYDCFSFVQSMLNRTGLRHNLLYNLLRGQGAKVLGQKAAAPGQVLTSLALGAVLGVISLPVTLLLGWVGRAGTMTALAVKDGEPERGTHALHSHTEGFTSGS